MSVPSSVGMSIGNIQPVRLCQLCYFCTRLVNKEELRVRNTLHLGKRQTTPEIFPLILF